MPTPVSITENLYNVLGQLYLSYSLRSLDIFFLSSNYSIPIRFKLFEVFVLLLSGFKKGECMVVGVYIFSISTVIEPFLVNLKAFPIRFIRTYLSLF